MASARSTVSIARTTPAQKPRGEHNITFSGGFSQRDVIKGFRRFARGRCAGRPRPPGFGFSLTPLSSMGAAETHSFHAERGLTRPELPRTRPGGRRGAAKPANLSISPNIFAIGLRKPVGRAYIPSIPVIPDGNKASPRRAGGAQGDFTWRPSP